MKYDVRGPAGNVFAVLGRFSSVVKQLEKAGIDCTKHRHLLEHTFKDMTYDQILDRIEELTNGSITFVGRTNQDDDDE